MFKINTKVKEILSQNTLSILTVVIFWFSQILEVNAKFWIDRSQENIFITVDPKGKIFFSQKK